MPTFQMHNNEINAIVTGWGAKGNVEMPTELEKAMTLTPQQEADGKNLFAKLQCLNCHTVGRHATPDEMDGGTKGLAPDLIYANKRLRYEWIVELLKDPQKMIPGTRMPGFWPDGQSSLPDVMGGDSEKQIRVLASYLISLGGKIGTKEPLAQKVSQHLRNQTKRRTGE